MMQPMELVEVSGLLAHSSENDGLVECLPLHVFWGQLGCEGNSLSWARAILSQNSSQHVIVNIL